MYDENRQRDLAKTLTPEKFKEAMEILSSEDDTEYRHINADILMCGILRDLGYGEGVKIFERWEKWYA